MPRRRRTGHSISWWGVRRSVGRVVRAVPGGVAVSGDEDVVMVLICEQTVPGVPCSVPGSPSVIPLIMPPPSSPGQSQGHAGVV